MTLERKKAARLTAAEFFLLLENLNMLARVTVMRLIVG
jgi:hypothetical protein